MCVMPRIHRLVKTSVKLLIPTPVRGQLSSTVTRHPPRAGGNLLWVDQFFLDENTVGTGVARKLGFVLR